jgi:hypothetical protein
MPKTETKRKLTGSPGSQKRVKKAMTYKDGVYSSGVTARPYVKKIGKGAQKVADTYADLRDKVIIKDKRDRAIYKEARDKDRARKFESYEDYKKRMKKFREDKKPQNKKDGGMMKKNLKPVDKEKNPGLAKLPEEVRNKMGFMKDGGDVTNIPPSQRRIAEKLKNFIEKNGRTPSTDAEIDSVYGKGAVDKEMRRLGAKKMKDGGMVLEIGLRPATAKENKMAKEMMGKKPKKMAGGGMVSRGTGAAIRGTKFKGVF